MQFPRYSNEAPAEKWLRKRGWNIDDIKSVAGPSRARWPRFRIAVENKPGVILSWEGQLGQVGESIRFVEELVEEETSEGRREILRTEVGRFKCEGEDWDDSYPDYEGSILPYWPYFPSECNEICCSICNIVSMDVFNFSPSDSLDLSKKYCDDQMDLTAGLIELSRRDVEKKILPVLQKFFPQVKDVRIRRRSDCKEVGFVETVDGKDVVLSGRQAGQGFIRLLGILVRMLTPGTFITIDDLETGISIDWVSELMKIIEESGKQVLFTTNSTLVMNFVDDDKVRLLFRKPGGATAMVNFVDIPSMKKKLAVFCPGDALISSSLREITDEALAFTSQASPVKPAP
ncbi:AAA family ATPase [Sutterella sp.]|uniref:AAA family ATPase n=1 Tax=Sutterella sp. TaxID=1981025 RepID=UPI0026DF1375|nr:AAA family ATPase [Sutterella sp.]MDO5532834.1 AAA family ATPase [Sutterella sp.]